MNIRRSLKKLIKAKRTKGKVKNLIIKLGMKVKIKDTTKSYYMGKIPTYNYFESIYKVTYSSVYGIIVENKNKTRKMLTNNDICEIIK